MTTAAPGSPGRRGWWIVAVLLVAALLPGAIWWASGDADGDAGVVAPGTTATSTRPSATTTASVEGVPDDASALWPAPGSSSRFDSPEEAARSFAADYLGFASPQIGEFRAGDARSGEVPVRPRERGPVTTILVRQVDGSSPWSVVGASSDNIQVAAPAAGDEIRSPVAVAGRAWTFEGNVVVQVREDGEPEPIGEGFVTGGGTELSPFEGSVSFRASGAPHGAALFLEHSAQDGQLWQASVVRVAFASEEPSAGD